MGEGLQNLNLDVIYDNTVKFWKSVNNNTEKCLWLSGYAKCNVSASTYIL